MGNTAESTATAAERLAYSRAELPAIGLNFSNTTLWRLERAGLLRPVAGVRSKFYARAEVERFLASRSAQAAGGAA
jgi:hypothetical protein